MNWKKLTVGLVAVAAIGVATPVAATTGDLVSGTHSPPSASAQAQGAMGAVNGTLNVASGGVLSLTLHAELTCDNTPAAGKLVKFFTGNTMGEGEYLGEFVTDARGEAGQTVTPKVGLSAVSLVTSGVYAAFAGDEECSYANNAGPVKPKVL